jgi:hypothetical protein
MIIDLVNPSDTSFGTAVITPRWLYVIAAATAKSFGDPKICDETLEHLNLGMSTQATSLALAFIPGMPYAGMR